jgi:hypothetical protein
MNEHIIGEVLIGFTLGLIVAFTFMLWTGVL